MSKFGSSITYKIVDIISIFNKYGQEYFETKRNEYLESQNEHKDSNLYKINVEKIKKLIEFIKNNIDSLTCENEMKMECYFNKNEPAFVNGEVNRKLFNFSYADKIYNFAQKNNLDMRMHTIVWYRHFPKQLLDYLDGKSYEKKRNLKKVFPGYVLVKMIVTEESWYIVRNTRGVTGFVGSGTDPIPLTNEEIRNMGFEATVINVDYDVNDTVRVVNGPLASFIGTVQEINKEKNKVKVLVSMFGRETPVELEFSQVEKI